MRTDDRREGKLIFERQGMQEEWSILWEPRSGNVAEGQTWKAVVSFSEDWKLPPRVKDLVFEYLRGDAIAIYLGVDAGTPIKCNALFEPEELEDFSMWGVMPVGSLDLRRPYLK